MVRIEKTVDGFEFFNDKGERTIEEVFEEIHETKDIKGYFLGKNIWGDILLVSSLGNLVCNFSANAKPKGVYSLIDDIVKNVDNVRKVKALEFFDDKNVKDVIDFKHKAIFEKAIKQAKKNKDVEKATGLVVLYDLEKSFLDTTFSKNASSFKKQQKINERKEMVRSRAIKVLEKNK